jgi:hypothetical protein
LAVELGDDDLRQEFHDDVFGLLPSWRDKGIDTRGIASGVGGCEIHKIADWILRSGSRKRFDQVLQTLGPAYTVESRLLDPKYELISSRYPDACEKAKGRLYGHRDD